MSDQRDDGLTDELKAGLRDLPRDLSPNDLLEERVVRALKTRGLLGPRRAWRQSVRWVAAMAAALSLFFSGLIVGRLIAPQAMTAQVLAVTPKPQARLPINQVQLTETACVRAISALSNRATGKVNDQRREAALEFLRGVVGDFSQVDQGGAASPRTLEAQREVDSINPVLSSTAQQTFWF
jgi:hypothetical protein